MHDLKERETKKKLFLKDDLPRQKLSVSLLAVTYENYHFNLLTMHEKNNTEEMLGNMQHRVQSAQGATF